MCWRVQPKQRSAVVALLRTISAQESAGATQAQWKQVVDTLQERFSKLAELMDASREDVLVYMAFPREHWTQVASTPPPERLNGEIKRRSAVIRLVGALTLE
jgi:transposase-like protein